MHKNHTTLLYCMCVCVCTPIILYIHFYLVIYSIVVIKYIKLCIQPPSQIIYIGRQNLLLLFQSCLTFCDPMDWWSLLKLMSIESVMPSNHLVLCHPLLFLPSIFHSIRAFSNEQPLHIRQPRYWSFSINLSNEYSGLISFRIDWFDLQENPLIKRQYMLQQWLYIFRAAWNYHFFHCRIFEGNLFSPQE